MVGNQSYESKRQWPEWVAIPIHWVTDEDVEELRHAAQSMPLDGAWVNELEQERARELAMVVLVPTAAQAPNAWLRWYLRTYHRICEWRPHPPPAVFERQVPTIVRDLVYQSFDLCEDSDCDTALAILAQAERLNLPPLIEWLYNIWGDLLEP